jgi:hypothetical protein
MEQLTSTAGSVLEKFGKTFLIVGYVPALLFVLAHQWLIFPVWLGYPLTIFGLPPVTAEEAAGGSAPQLPFILSINVTTLVLPLLIGILLLALNSVIIRLYEGRVWLLQRILLRPLYQRNLARCRQLYGNIVKLKAQHRTALVDLSQAIWSAEQLAAQQKIDALATVLEAAFTELENKVPQQRLPMREHHIAPTALGNVYAIAEEYPFDRYGIDSVLLWPRLRPLLDKADPDHVERLVNQKTVLDMTLSLSLLSGLFGLELLVTLAFRPTEHALALGVAASIAIAFYWVFYQAGVSATQTLGQCIMTSFDFHRHLVLQRFGLEVPADLQAEQVAWLKLAAFLRRGEAYYWPAVQTTAAKTAHSDVQQWP